MQYNLITVKNKVIECDLISVKKCAVEDIFGTEVNFYQSKYVVILSSKTNPLTGFFLVISKFS